MAPAYRVSKTTLVIPATQPACAVTTNPLASTPRNPALSPAHGLASTEAPAQCAHPNPAKNPLLALPPAPPHPSNNANAAGCIALPSRRWKAVHRQRTMVGRVCNTLRLIFSVRSYLAHFSAAIQELARI